MWHVVFLQIINSGMFLAKYIFYYEEPAYRRYRFRVRRIAACR